MSKFKVEFSMDSVAFNDATLETAAVLACVIVEMWRQPTWAPGHNRVRDSNGKPIGFWEYIP